MGKISKAVVLVLINFIGALLAYYISCAAFPFYGVPVLLAFLLSHYLLYKNSEVENYFYLLCLLLLFQPIIFPKNYFIVFSPVVFTAIYFFLFAKTYFKNTEHFLVLIAVLFLFSYYASFNTVQPLIFRFVKNIFNFNDISRRIVEESYFSEDGILFFSFNFFILAVPYIYLLFTRRK